MEVRKSIIIMINSKPRKMSTSELKAILRQHWEHSRHCEIQMLWFTSIYAAVVAGILAFIAETYKNNSTDLGPTPLLAFFGLILSLVGFLITVALTLGHHDHKMNVSAILYYWDKMEFFVFPKKPFRYKTAHRWFFEITISLFAVLSLFYAPKSWNFLAIFQEQRFLVITAIIILVFIEVLYQWRWEKYSIERFLFRKALLKDKKGKYRNNWDYWFEQPEFWKKITKDALANGIIEDEKPWICRTFRKTRRKTGTST